MMKMRIGRLEIRWLSKQGAQQAGSAETLGALAVPDTAPWWLAVHYILDTAERETIETARKVVANSNMTIAAIGAGEGIDLVRIKLKEARDNAIQENRVQQISRT